MGDRAIVHPVPVIHEFGGIKFVETGETRILDNDEFGLCDGMLIYNCKNKWTAEYPILKRYSDDARPNGHEE